MNKNLNFKELRELAKKNGIPTPVGTSTEKLKKILTERGLLNTPKVNTPEIKPAKMIEIPEDLKHLGLTPVKIKTLDEVEINNRLNTAKKLVLPNSVMERLEREGYKVSFPTEPYVQNIMQRGGQFIKRDGGKTYKIDSGGCNEKGERIYHIAMKIRKEILNREDDLFRQSQSNAKKKKEQGDVGAEVSKLLKVDPKYLKITEKTNNKL